MILSTLAASSYSLNPARECSQLKTILSYDFMCESSVYLICML